MAFNDTHRTARELMIKGGKVIAYEMPATSKIFKGDIVRIAAAGYATSIGTVAQFDTFAGIALETVDNSAGAAGGKSVRCLTEGVVSLVGTTINTNDNGMLASIAAASTSSITVGDPVGPLCTPTGIDDANNWMNVGMFVGIAENDMIATGVSTTKQRVLLQTFRQAFQ